jgi:hypothetical protein
MVSAVRLVAGLSVAVFALAMGMVGACSPANFVEYQFGWIKTVIPDLGEPLQENPEWHRIYPLTDEQVTKILSMDFKEQGYTGWKPYQGRQTLMDAAYHLDGYATPTQVCYKDDGSYKFDPPWNTIAMFVETEKKRLVLVYGITYGR